MRTFSIAVVLALACSTGSRAGAPVVTGSDAAGVIVSVDEARWAQLTPQTVEVVEKDKTRHRYTGPTLAALLTACGAPLGDKLKGPPLGIAVVVEAVDGYRVVLGLSEVDGALSGRTMVLARTRDGAALPQPWAPLALVIPGDARQTRWIRQVSAIRLVEIPAPVGENIGPQPPR